MTQEQLCYYGFRVGCPEATNPNCRMCAERLAGAVGQMQRSARTRDLETTGNADVSFGDDGSSYVSDLSRALLSYSRERS